MTSVSHLVGRKLPDMSLLATDGTIVKPMQLAGIAVIFCYPWTGRPGWPNPPGWDEIPGAHGSTPQAQAYSMAYDRFLKIRSRVFGLSFQDTVWQREFVGHCALRFPLLSDSGGKFAGDLSLPVFTTGGVDYLQRLTLVCSHGAIIHVRYPVDPPEADAEESLGWLQSR